MCFSDGTRELLIWAVKYCFNHSSAIVLFPHGALVDEAQSLWNEKGSEITLNYNYSIILGAHCKKSLGRARHRNFSSPDLTSDDHEFKYKFTVVSFIGPLTCCKGQRYLELMSLVFEYLCWSFNKGIKHRIVISSCLAQFWQQKYCESKINDLLPLLFVLQFVLKDRCIFCLQFHNYLC